MILASALLTFAGAAAVVLGVVTDELGFIYAAIAAACSSLLMLSAGVARSLRRDAARSGPGGDGPTGDGPTGSEPTVGG